MTPPRPQENPRDRNLFAALEQGTTDRVPRDRLLSWITEAGLRSDDPRIYAAVSSLQAQPEQLDFDGFCSGVRPSYLLLERVLTGQLVVPDFQGFARQIGEMFEECRDARDGAVATYIPQLARANPESFGLGLCTIDGQRLALGDARAPFCVQSTCKVVNYALALEARGEAEVHRYIGREPSGHGFNELTLNRHGRPHNPMINAGAIIACAMIEPNVSRADRFDRVMQAWRRFAGNEPVGYDNSTYLSERETADRNYALAYFMRENGAFPEGSSLEDTLEFYFQCCSISATADQMSVVAATLANGGVCPLTQERVVSPHTVRDVLSMMYSCGMYDFSGEYAFTIGLPAKSGVAGALMIVVPNVMGLCVWSPPLDDMGNSVRGIAFSRLLVERFNLHNYDSLRGLSPKNDPRQPSEMHVQHAELMWAASRGDLPSVMRLVGAGVDVDAVNYDRRSALHVAAAEGHAELLQYLLTHASVAAPTDRWGATPLDAARQGGHAEAVALIEANMERRAHEH